jgi:hypothetical protein
MDRPVDSNPDPAAGGSRRRARSWDAPVLVALASVLVALVYNGVQASNSAQQLDQGQRTLRQGQNTLKLSSAAQTFTTFMEMHDHIVRSGAEIHKAALAFVEDSSDDNKLRLLNAITPLEGIVFALEGGVLPADAGEVWANYLACDYRLAKEAFGEPLSKWVPTLAAFSRRTAVRPELCPVHL